MSNFKPILTLGTNELEIDWEYTAGVFQQLDDRYLKEMLDALNYFIYLVKQEQINRQDRQDRPITKGGDNENPAN